MTQTASKARPHAILRLNAGRSLALDRPRIMGILNVTPDSFSDGGEHATVEAAVEAAVRMHRQGAVIIDVGGESTRPGAQAIEVDEQIRRTAPVIAGVRRELDRDALFISIDTTRAAVAEAALEAGADLINDISAGRDDDQMFPLAAARGAGVILMHRLRSPHADSYSTDYATPPEYGGDVVAAVRAFLAGSAERAIRAGVSPESIVVDPGLGFGKTVQQNYELAGRVDELMELGFPVLSAASRKSFLGAVSDEPSPAQRVMGTVALSVAHWFAGVRLFRVHDVLAHRQALAVAEALGAAERRA